MRKITLLFFTIIFSINGFSQAPNWQWARAIGAISNDEGYSITFDASGNVYTTGYFVGTVDFDPGPGVYNLTALPLVNDAFISKLDASGNFIWAKQFSDTDHGVEGDEIAIDASGNIYTTGFFEGTVDFDPGPATFFLTSAGNEDIFVSKLDSMGNFVWAKGIGGPSYDDGISVALDSSTNVYVAGSFSSTVDFDPGAGVFNLTSSGNEDFYITKLNSAGNFVWAKASGGTSGDRIISIAVDGFGKVYSTGSFFSPSIICGSDTLINADNSGSTYDIYIAKLTGNCSAHFGVYPDTSQLHTYWAVNNASGTPPLNYDWDWGDASPHDFTAYPSHTYATAGFYTICLSITDGAGCSNSYCDTFTLARMNTLNAMVYVNVVPSIPTSIEANQKPDVSIYPNPANEEIVLRFSNEMFYDISLRNTLGELLFEKTIRTVQMKIDMRSFNSGIYFVSVHDENGNKTVRKIVKM